MSLAIHLSEGLRMFLRSIEVRIKGIPRYHGDAMKICAAIVDNAWNGRYFMVSSGHFRVFYCRDLAWCAESLKTLGYQDRLKKTLDYALGRFESYGRITVAINPKGMCFDFPNPAPDSFAGILHALRIVDDYDLVLKYKQFLNKEAKRYYQDFVTDGLIDKDFYFSSIRDHALRSSSCYNNTMLAVVKRNLDYFSLENPFSGYDYEKLLVQRFWNGKFFEEDSSKHGGIVADANIFPFWYDVVKDVKKLKSSLREMEKAGLCDPYPIKYESRPRKNFTFHEFFAPNYEGNAIWAHMAPMYLKLVKRVESEKGKKLIAEYVRLVEHHGNYLEVFHPSGKPYSSFFYYSDEGMLWASMLLELL